MPKKELGQHWLKDQEALDRIVEISDLQTEDTVLEIGPGEGALTKVLLETGASVVALEFDRDLLNGLSARFSSHNNFKLLEGDIRKFDFSSLPSSYKIVANIPYYLTSNLIRAISETSNQPIKAVLLVQKEVAERICAKPGNMSVLSVVAQLYFECEQDIVVPAEYFVPAPKVDSQVVVLNVRNKKLIDVDDKKFLRIVKAGFSEKRKTLRNSLSGGLSLDKNAVETILEESDVENTARAQELSFDQWRAIYSIIESKGVL